MKPPKSPEELEKLPKALQETRYTGEICKGCGSAEDVYRFKDGREQCLRCGYSANSGAGAE